MSQKPNIIMIFADDMGFGDVGCNNPDSKIPTPHLDRMAEQGMRFTDMHAASSVCTPSRYGLLTGRYCWRTPLKSSVVWPWDPALIEPERTTVASLLRDQGYRTACFGKWHLGLDWETLDGRPPNEGVALGDFQQYRRAELGENIDFNAPVRGGPLDCGFDQWFGVDAPNLPPYAWIEQDRVIGPLTEEKPESMYGTPGCMTPGWRQEDILPTLTERTRDYIAQSGDDPFFIYLALTSPHTPIVPNPPFIGKSQAGPYGDFVCETDWVVGQVFEALEARGITDQTLVIFSTDNGPETLANVDGGTYEHIRKYGQYSMGELRGAKRDTWEGGHRVPFLAVWPDAVPAGSVCDRLGMLNDLPACFASLVGAPPCAEFEDSIDICSLFFGEGGASPRTAAVHHSCSGQFAIRDEDWIFIDSPSGEDIPAEPDWYKTLRGYTDHSYPGELYNLAVDLSERRNLYAEEPERVKTMTRRLRDIQRDDVPEGPPLSSDKLSE